MRRRLPRARLCPRFPCRWAGLRRAVGTLPRHDSRTVDRRRRARRTALLRDPPRPGPRRARHRRRPGAALRPPAALEGHAGRAAVAAAARWYAEHDVALRTGVAERLDATRRIVVLAGGERVRYDDLLIATGSEPVRLPALGGFANVQALRTHEDAVRLRAALAAGARLTVVGGGLIGLEVASAARRLGAEVTVVEAAPRLLPRLGPEVGADSPRCTARRDGCSSARRSSGAEDGLRGRRAAGPSGGPTAPRRGARAGRRHADRDRPRRRGHRRAARDRLVRGDAAGPPRLRRRRRHRQRPLGGGRAAGRRRRPRPARPPARAAGAALVLERPARDAAAVRRRPGRRARRAERRRRSGFEAVYRREGQVGAVLLAGRSAADLRAARRRLTPAPELERSAA